MYVHTYWFYYYLQGRILWIKWRQHFFRSQRWQFLELRHISSNKWRVLPTRYTKLQLKISLIVQTENTYFNNSGFPHSPYMPSGRTVTVMILLFTFMLYQFYSASIVSSLLMEPPRTITSFENLVKSKLKILIEDVSYNYDFFQVGTYLFWHTLSQANFKTYYYTISRKLKIPWHWIYIKMYSCHEVLKMFLCRQK